jgi:imidazolonepropionase-like amidohydrolase
MTPHEVLKSVTATNAEVFQMDNRIGRIKTGLLADMIIVDGDPKVNISKLRDIDMVMKGGKVYEDK